MLLRVFSAVLTGNKKYSFKEMQLKSLNARIPLEYAFMYIP